MIKYEIGPAEAHIWEPYVKYMKKISGTDVINLPGGILNSARGWELSRAMDYAGFKESDIVLDVGALHTFHSIFLALFVKRIYVTDSFYWMKRNCINMYMPADSWAKYIESKTNKAVVEEADVTALPYSDGFFDKVLCISTIEHVINDKKGIEEMMRVLKPGGKLLLTTEFNELHGKEYSETDGTYYRVYDPETLGKLLDGLNVEMCCIEKNCIELGKFTHIFAGVKK